MTGAFLIGAPVAICAKDDFYSFVDGWNGTIEDVNQGLYKVRCRNDDGQMVQLLVPGDQLRNFKA